MTDRALLQQALEALQAYGAHTPNCDHLMLLLSLPPQRKPCSCGLVATMQALRERLAQPEPDFYGYASRLAVAIWEQHYKDVAPQWKPLDDLIGVLTQIDNMTAGLTRLAQPEQEPVKESSITHSHLWIGDLYNKEKNT